MMFGAWPPSGHEVTCVIDAALGRQPLAWHGPTGLSSHQGHHMWQN
jgi:hypothetical protein